MPFVIDLRTRTAKWLAESTFLRAAQTFEGVPCHNGNLDLQDQSVLVNWRVLALMLSHPRKLRSFAQRPRNQFPFGQITLFANSLNEFSRTLPTEDEFACSFANEVDGNLVADHARRDRRHVSARGGGCRKGAALLPVVASQLNVGQSYRPSILATTKMKYCSATDQRANLDDERAWMNGD